jgi:ubiquinone/menaquinone biosynthesis C-methylase UbiE
MQRPDIAQEIVEFYSRDYDERARLTDRAHGRLEFLRTRELLRRFLPPAAEVLDVGGGPGTHARWLAEDGHRVHLIDPVPRHVSQAAAHGTFTTELGDARHLAQNDASVDAVLLLGPLYHLPLRADRIAALDEARRVLRPGGLVAAAAISRHALLLDQMATGRLTEQTPSGTDGIDATAATGRTDNFTTAHFHAVGELRDELVEVGFTGIELFGVEGPGWTILRGSFASEEEPFFASALTAARITESDPALQPASAHLLAFGRT